MTGTLPAAADYLYAVEAVVVDETGRANCIVATCEASDPHRDLWWAHTGGGGGNFGVVTRFWFRSPGAAGDDPAGLLPRAPESVTTFRAEWRWEDVDRPSFLRLLANHGTWCERNSAGDSRGLTQGADVRRALPSLTPPLPGRRGASSPGTASSPCRGPT